MTLSTRQAMTDDTGTKTDGTIVDSEFVDQIYDQVDDQCHSLTNTTIKPKATTDEVVSARGNMASLDQRLSVSINDDGELIDQGDFAAASDLASVIGPGSMVENDDMQVWCAGTSAAPTGWTLGGAGASVARSTSNSPPVGGASAALTRAGTDAALTQALITTLTTKALFLRSKYLSIGCYVWASVASRARLRVNDGVGTAFSEYHTGDSTWQWLSLAHLISASATGLSIGCEVNDGNTTAQFTGFSAVILSSETELPHYIPCPTIERVFQYSQPGAATAGAAKAIFIPLRMGYVRDVAISQNADADGSALAVDVNTWDGAAFTTMFGANQPTIADNAGDLTFDSSQPDTLARQGYRGSVNGTYQVGGAISIDFDTVGSGSAATDVTVTIHAIEYARPQERYIAYNEF